MLALVLAGALALVPQPRSVETAAGDVAVGPVRMLSGAPEDRFAAEQLGAAAQAGAAVLIGRAGEAATEREIAQRKLAREALRHPEGYLIHAAPGGILVAGADAAGVFYGVQTLRQAMRGGRVPRVTAADWPALRYRGLSVDISRGPVLTDEQMCAVVRTLAEYKLNMLSLYMEHVFPYRHAPLAAPRGAGITAEKMRQLSAYARRYHVDLVPQQQTFGHLHHVLKQELYADLANTRYGSVLAAEDERAYGWIRASAGELAAAMPGTFLHIGSDETAEIPPDAYMRHMRHVGEMLRPLGRRLMFWGDIALSHPEMLPELPKDMVAMSWTYDAKPDFTGWVAPFRRQGMAVFVCPGLNNWSRVFPNVSVAVANINGFVRDGKNGGAIGMLNTHWNDEGEALFNTNWYGIVFSAAAAWQPGMVDTAAFDATFDRVFYGGADPVAARAVARLDRAQQAAGRRGAGGRERPPVLVGPVLPPGRARRGKGAAGGLRAAHPGGGEPGGTGRARRAEAAARRYAAVPAAGRAAPGLAGAQDPVCQTHRGPIPRGAGQPKRPAHGAAGTAAHHLDQRHGGGLARGHPGAERRVPRPVAGGEPRVLAGKRPGAL